MIIKFRNILKDFSCFSQIIIYWTLGVAILLFVRQVDKILGTDLFVRLDTFVRKISERLS